MKPKIMASQATGSDIGYWNFNPRAVTFKTVLGNLGGQIKYSSTINLGDIVILHFVYCSVLKKRSTF